MKLEITKCKLTLKLLKQFAIASPFNLSDVKEVFGYVRMPKIGKQVLLQRENGTYLLLDPNYQLRGGNGYCSYYFGYKALKGEKVRQVPNNFDAEVSFENYQKVVRQANELGQLFY